MKNITKVAVIGAGGIGRSLALVASEYGRRDIDYVKKIQWTWFDHDEVEEANCWTQGFQPHQAFECAAKVDALKEDFGKTLFITPRSEKIDNDNLTDLIGMDMVFIAVDNLETRRMVYGLCQRHNIPFVDMRVNGTLALIQDSTCSPEELADSLESNGSEEDAAPTSCLAKWEKEQKLIHTTPLVAASLGFQFMLNIMRGHRNEVTDLNLGGE